MPSNISLINGIIIGGGATLAIFSATLLTTIGALEGVLGFTAMEIRAAIFLGAVVSATAIAYEIYLRNKFKLDKSKNKF